LSENNNVSSYEQKYSININKGQNQNNNVVNNYQKNNNNLNIKNICKLAPKLSYTPTKPD